MKSIPLFTLDFIVFVQSQNSCILQLYFRKWSTVSCTGWVFICACICVSMYSNNTASEKLCLFVLCACFCKSWVCRHVYEPVDNQRGTLRFVYTHRWLIICVCLSMWVSMCMQLWRVACVSKFKCLRVCVCVNTCVERNMSTPMCKLLDSYVSLHVQAQLYIHICKNMCMHVCVV